MRVREDRVRRRDGSEGIYGVVEKPDFAVIAPYEYGHLYLVEQYRYPVGRRYWELPQGSWPGGAGQSTIALARAELLEETGLVAERIEQIGRLHPSSGFCTQACDVFVATGLDQTGPAREIEEQDMICARLPVARVDEMIRAGAITDAPTVAALSLMRLHELP